MSFAIIETGGKQYKVSASKILEVEKLNFEIGKTIQFKNPTAITAVVVAIIDPITTVIMTPTVIFIFKSDNLGAIFVIFLVVTDISNTPNGATQTMLKTKAVSQPLKKASEKP